MLPDNPDDQARLFYLLLLGVVIAGSLFYGQRHRLGRTVRDLAVWAMIFVMVIIAYGFRDTLRGGLFPSEMTQTEEGAVAIRRGSDGHFHATLEVNGAPIRFMIDTGATGVVLSRRDAARAGIDLDGLRFGGRAQTANGMVAIAPVRLADLRLGPIVDRDVPASVGGGDFDTSLLGMSYLDRFARLEIEGDRMILRR